MIVYVRTCQECGHEQTSDVAPGYRAGGGGWCDPDDPSFDCACRRCGSAAMDYGSWREG